jgi:hypothetical protein
MRLAAIAGVIAGLVVCLGPGAARATGGTADRAAASAAGPTRPPATLGITPLHRIAVRSVIGSPAEFFDTVTGKTFIPRGNNYIRLRHQYHSTFDPGAYDPSGAEAALSEMRRLGYNVVRVFFNSQAMGRRLGEPGLNARYMRNVLDFLSRAAAHDVYVMISSQWLPTNYGEVVNAGPPRPDNVEGINEVFMSSGYITAAERFWTDVVTWIKTADRRLLSTVFSYDIWNEPAFQSDQKPFSLTRGLVSPVGGGQYDMSDPDSRQAAADRSAQHWANQIAHAIKEVDPLALTTASVFTPRGVGRSGYDGVQPSTDSRAPMRALALSQSSLDYVDLHTYPTGPRYSLTEDLESAEIGSLAADKPRIIGEVGALRSAFRNGLAAALLLANLQSASCRHSIRGWVLWTWDSDVFDEPGFWSALENNGAINRVMAPVNRPDGCSPARALPTDHLGESAGDLIRHPFGTAALLRRLPGPGGPDVSQRGRGCRS